MATKKGEFMKYDLLKTYLNKRRLYQAEQRHGRRGEFQSTKMLKFRCWNERCRLMRGAAFTLAEVLITLAIIGVVAAMTLPTLIQNHQKQTYVNGLKKAVSVSQNMLKKMQADEGASSVGMTRLFSDGICKSSFYSDDPSSNGCEDAYGNPSVFEEIIPNYLNVVKKCSGDNCNSPLYKSSTLGCRNNECSLSVSNNADKKACDYVSPYVCTNTRGFYTNDGMIYYIGAWPFPDPEPEQYPHAAPRFIRVGVDVNGEKGPNIVGRDFFVFLISSNGKVGGEASGTTTVEHLMQNGWKMDY